MKRNHGKSRKDNSEASPESSTNVSSKLREEKEGQQTGGEKSVTTLPTDATTVLDEAKENVVNAAEEARRVCDLINRDYAILSRTNYSILLCGC
jgi:hypothetical protein